MRSEENNCEIALLEGLDEGTKIVEEGEIAAALTVYSEKEEGKRPLSRSPFFEHIVLNQ